MNKTNLTFGEKIYDFPLLYKIKIDILNKINGLPVNINRLIKNKYILDIGCGSYQTRYDPAFAKKRAGLDPSFNAIKIARLLYPKDHLVVGTAEKLPFPKGSFDVSLLFYTLHHIEKNKWEKVLKEAKRVTKSKIIIFDHVKNENPFLSSIQMLYWHNIDGGDYYAGKEEWKTILKNYKISGHKRFGKLFNHICFYEINLDKG